MNKSDITLKNLGDCILATHSSDIAGPPDHFIEYLKNRTNYLFIYKFPLAKNDSLKANYRVYLKGELIKEYNTDFQLYPFILNFLLDFVRTMIWSVRLKYYYKLKKINLFIGCNNFLSLSGLITKKWIKADLLIFYAVDYAQKRFNNSLINDVYLWIDNFMARHADYVWSNTNRTRKVREKQGTKPDSNILVINGVWLSKINGTKEKRNDNNIKIEYHGYISESKGVHNVIKALNLLENTNFDLDIIGYGPYENIVKEEIEKSKFKNKIHFIGKLSNEEILKKLSNYDLCLNLTNMKDNHQYFGDSMKVKEALACKLPILTSNVSEIAETIRERQLGEVVEDSEDIDEIATKLKDIFDNPEKLNVYRKNILEIIQDLDWNNIYNNALTKAIK